MAITECPMPLLPSITLLGKVMARTGEKATAFLRKTVGTTHLSPVGGCIAGEYWGGYRNQSVNTGAGRRSRTPKTRRSADFESNPFTFQTPHFLDFPKTCGELPCRSVRSCEGLLRASGQSFGRKSEGPR